MESKINKLIFLQTLDGKVRVKFLIFSNEIPFEI